MSFMDKVNHQLDMNPGLDKVLHFVIGFVMLIFINVFFEMVWGRNLWGVLITIGLIYVVAIGKEIQGLRTHGVWDWYDVIATVTVPSLLTVIMVFDRLQYM